MATITDPTEFQQVVRRMAGRGRCAIDTETTGVRPFEGDRLCALSLYHPEEGSFFIPVRMQGLGVENMPEKALAVLGPELLGQAIVEGRTTRVRTQLLIGHNLSHDLNFFRVEGFDVDGAYIFDTMYASFLWNDSLPSYALKGPNSVSETILGLPPSEELDRLNIWKKAHPNTSYDYCSVEVLAPYAERDVVLAWDLYEKLESEIIARGEPYPQLLYEEMQWVKLLAGMSATGLLFDFERAAEIRKSHNARIMKLYEELSRECWPGFNPNAPKAVMSLLRQLDIDAPDTEVGTLWLYAGAHPVLRKVIEARQLAHVLASYINKWEVQARRGGGRVYASFGATGHGYGDDYGQTRTGRVRARQPNLMGVPVYDSDIHREKEVYRAPEGWVYGAIDVSQADIRVAAHYLKDDRLDAVLSDPQGDIHGMIAEDVGLPRIRAKRVVFGSGLYGAGAARTAEVMTDESHQLVTESEAAAFIRAFQRRYPKFKVVAKQVEGVAKTRGYLRIWDGRQLFVGERDDPHKTWNWLIQMGVANLMKKWMLRIKGYLHENGMQSRMVLQIHDEIILEMPREEANALGDLAKLIEGIGPEGGWRVPLFTKTKQGERWSEL